MAKANKVRQPSDLRRHVDILEDIHKKKKKPSQNSSSSEKKEWKDALCAVCLEYPHKAVLLLCSSHEKGCRPYMCATSCRYSNCLDQYTKAYTKDDPKTGNPDPASSGSLCLNEKMDMSSLMCPLCRGEVKGWTVVERARRYLNSKRRSCMQEECEFAGSYNDLKKHVRCDHPRARPREVDPVHAEKWKKLEREREQSDVMSTIRSTMPGAIVMGDYVIERGGGGGGGGFFDLDEVIMSLQSFGGGGGRSNRGRSSGDGGFMPWPHRINRLPVATRLLGGSRRRHRGRMSNSGGSGSGGGGG